MKPKYLVLAAASLFAANAMACYTVYDRVGLIAYQGEAPPVDMSLPLHTALQSRYPGGHMVFEQATNCQPIGLGQIARARGPGAAPNTAVMGSQLAVATSTTVIEQPAMSQTPGVPNTAVMGAGPAATVAKRVSVVTPRAPARGSSPLLTDRRTAESMRLPYTALSGDVVVVPAQAPRRVDTVITELHNPPMTVVHTAPR